MPALGAACLGALTFCASTYPNDKCGPNGLPLTPNSIKLLGRFQKLRAIEHPRLCTYLDLVRGKHERVIIVTEHYLNNLSLEANAGKYNGSDVLSVAYEILDGLSYMNQHGLVHRNLSLDNILLDQQNHVKLSKYGMYHMTGFGADVSFPVGKPQYLSPEAMCSGTPEIGDWGSSDLTQVPSGPKVDVWALGIVLLEMVLGGPIWSQLTVSQIFYKVMGFIRSELHPLDLLLKDCVAQNKVTDWPEGLEQMLRICLTVSPKERPLPCELMEHAIFTEICNNQVAYRNGFNMFSIELRCRDLEIEPFDEEAAALEEVDHLAERSIQEVYYLWQLAGGDLFGTLKKAGLLKSKQPVMSLSSFVTEDGELFGQARDHSILLDDTIILLSLEPLRQRLDNINEEAYYPLLEEDSCNGLDTSRRGLPTSPSNVDLSETARLPLVIREKDVEYQFHRIIFYERLLKAYPYKRPHIWREARVDIPPLVRGLVWSALLEVEGDVYGRYDAIDKETPTQTDRQIEVDVPRCHQYNELLSSPTGHAKFKRILKAWVATHLHYVYWQGLDSLCAPFLYLNFNDEALAYACFTAFIPKYLHKFFLKDNSFVIQEYLAVFSHLIAFHEPALSNHLDGIGFIPDLYAIPWFLTMYAHVFPLHKIFHLWDTLLLGNSSFPLCIGVAILQQLRDQLLSYGFNECILLFSDMPEIDIQRCVQDSIKIFCTTPKSATYRQHARPPRKPTDHRHSRPNVSYYSQDYHDMPKTELSMEPIPLDELKVEKCCRISAEDLIDLCELRGHAETRSPSKKSVSSKPRMVIIDVRSADEYQRGSVLNAISIPFANAFDTEGHLQNTAAVQLLKSQRNLVKVVLGSRGKNAVHFAEALLKEGYSKVCVLHKGVEVVRAAGLLVVPTPEL